MGLHYPRKSAYKFESTSGGLVSKLGRVYRRRLNLREAENRHFSSTSLLSQSRRPTITEKESVWSRGREEKQVGQYFALPATNFLLADPARIMDRVE